MKTATLFVFLSFLVAVPVLNAGRVAEQAPTISVPVTKACPEKPAAAGPVYGPGQAGIETKGKAKAISVEQCLRENRRLSKENRMMAAELAELRSWIAEYRKYYNDKYLPWKKSRPKSLLEGCSTR